MMYTSHLNLLPPEKRERLRRMIFMQFVRKMLETFLIILCLSGMMLLGGQWIMEDYFSAVVSTITASRTSNESHTQMRKINSILKTTDGLQKKYQTWTNALTELSNSVPSGITLTNLTLDADGSMYQIDGEALARNDLLEFKSQLENMSGVANIDIPLSTLAQKENFSFSIRVSLGDKSSQPSLPAPIIKTPGPNSLGVGNPSL